MGRQRGAGGGGDWHNQSPQAVLGPARGPPAASRGASLISAERVYARRRSRETLFGPGFDSRRLHHMENVHKLGVDIGRVIIGTADADGKADTSFLSGSEDRALETPAAEGAFEAIRDLVEVFEGRVWLVSKCGPRIQNLTKRWLEHHSFYDRTGLAKDHLRFCLKRPEKRVHCEELGLTVFVDDRLDVLEHLRGVVGHLILFGHQRPGTAVPCWVTHAFNWREVRGTLL